MRKVVTVPAAGKTESFQLTGVSVVVEAMPVYSTPDQVPLLSFGNEGTGGYPLYPRSVYPNPQGRFNRLQVTGTTESAGNSIHLVTFDGCMEPELNLLFSATQKAVAGQTFVKSSTDAAQQLATLEITKDGRLPNAVYVSARTNQVVYAFDVDPTQAADGYTLNVDDPPVKIEGLDFIQKFRFASAATAVPGELIVTCEY